MYIHIVKTAHVHHVATRFVHPIPSLVPYNREYLQSRTQMRLLPDLNKQNKKVILTSDGINKMSHTRRRTLWQLQLKTCDSIQLLPCLSLFCTCPLCLDIVSCRLSPGCKCSQCSTFYQCGGWNETTASISFSLPRKPPNFMCIHTHYTSICPIWSILPCAVRRIFH